MNVLNTKLWSFDIKTDGKGGMLSGIREEKLRQFVKRCDPSAKLTDDNAEEWILRYIIEDEGYPRNKIIRVKIKK